MSVNSIPATADSPYIMRESEQVAGATRVVWPDAMRAVALLWVVTIHVAAVPVAHLFSTARPWWWWANLYNSASRAAVPLFIMVSGALLLNGPWRGLRYFASRRIAKVVVPLIAWTFLYMEWRIVLRDEHFDWAEIVRHLFRGLVDPVYPHLWFLYLILVLYLCVPVLRPVMRAGSAAVQFGIVAACFAVQAARLLTAGKSAAYVGFDLGSLVGCLGYFTAGAVLARFAPSRVSLFALVGCVAAFLSGVIAAGYGTYVLTLQNEGVLDEFFLATLAPDVIVMTLSAFVIIRHAGSLVDKADSSPNSIGMLLRVGAVLAYGVYLVHPMVIDVVDLIGLPLDPMPCNPAWYVPFVLVVVLGLSMMIASMLRHTSATRWLLP